MLCVFTFLLCVSISRSFSQQGSLLFHHLKLEDGLSELTNEYVYKDSRGFIWISSILGLNRFDGTRVRRYLPDQADSTSIYGSNIQSNFFEDASSNLWFSTWEAVNCYDRKHDCFSHFFLSDSLQPLIVGYNAFHLDSLNQLWLIAGDQLIYTYNILTKDHQLITRLQQHSQRAIAISDPSGRVKRIFTYIASFPGVEEIELDQNGKIISDQVQWTGINEPTIMPRKIIAEGDSILWIAGANEIIKYNIASRTTRRTRAENILTIEHFNDSLLLVSVDDQGVLEFNKMTMAFGYQYLPEYDNSLSLLTNKINYISRDRDNGLWVSSTGFGICYAYSDMKKFKLYNPVSIRDAENSKFSPNGFIENSSNRIFCSTQSGGLFILDRECQVYKKISGKGSETNPEITGIYRIFSDSRKHIWLSSYFGLSVISDPFENIHDVSDQSKVMLDGIEMEDGRIIFTAMPGGLYEVLGENDTYTLHQIKPETLRNAYSPLQQDKRGRIWINENLLQFIILDASFNVIDTLPIKGMCSSFIETKEGNTIWIASSEGLYNVNAENLTIRKVYNEQNGLASVGLNSMLMNEDGNLWLSSTKGLIVFNPETETSKVYNYEDGLPTSAFNRYGAYRFDDGEMWFGSASGITKFHPDKLLNINIDAIPQITVLLVNGKAHIKKLICENTQSTNLTEIQKLTFSYRENTLTFTLNALEYSAPHRNKVKYKMENFDADWVETGSGSEVRYPNLPAGSYSFVVQAANSDGVYSNALRRLDLVITPPFYKTWWFIMLASMAVLGLVAYIVYLNFSKTIELQKVRLRLYENLHDDVGSRLTAIVLSAEELINQDKFVHPKLQHIAKVSKSIVGNMRRLVWAIDPENDSMNSLVQKIRYDKSLILDDKIECHIDIDQHLKQTIVPGEIRYQVTSIINEALNNISKYAQAKNVWIQFNKKDNELKLTIRDDGIGFNVGEVSNDKVRSSGYGLGNMQKRVSRVKGGIAIRSKPGEGTMIEVSIPFR